MNHGLRRTNAGGIGAETQLLKRWSVELPTGAEAVGRLEFLERGYRIRIELAVWVALVIAPTSERRLDFGDAVRGGRLLARGLAFRRVLVLRFLVGGCGSCRRRRGPAASSGNVPHR